MGWGHATVLQTTKASIGIQFLTGILGLYGLSLPIQKDGPEQVLRDILTLEMIVQAVEFVFYIVLVYIAHIETMTLLRYGDWFLSTPTMLFTMATYFQYASESRPNSLDDVWNSKRDAIVIIWIANFAMLLFGLLGELGLIRRMTGFYLGTLCLLVSFGLLYTEFGSESRAKPLYITMATLWSFYGLAYLQSSAVKNIAYNGLDILAKNFFGVYLAFILWRNYQEKTPKT
jgi:bacteriorhodopsin